MQRVGFVLKIHPGTEKEYQIRHQHVYPELLRAFKAVGIQTYSIFMYGNTLFAYMEVSDFTEAMQILSSHPTNKKWQEYMADILMTDEQGNSMHIIPEVFHFHG
ncbi:L-rhamnose mutarotase [Sulfobacillus thermosulfidooxidans]|uniref:L-rhamnose mutarotase n=1 Tax=Sulfobacillus thermosulfidooxidans TaxID=28034 RepID=UPI0006B6562D|nr:L-rhamnose mutarotase [Sulfobacillus thermosulfidooxidans]